MRIVNSILTKSDCYRTGRKITVRGLILHSVGTPQPNALVFVRNWDRPGIPKGVHAFLGSDGIVYQTLPWNHRAWHIGGSGNNTHIGVEMTEPATIKYVGGSRFVYSSKDLPAIQAHVRGTYATAVELFAYLCTRYGLNPLKDGVILSHKEGHKRGIGSNHGDPEHLWDQTKVGFTMNSFRRDVYKRMQGGEVKVESATTSKYKYPTTIAEIKKLQQDLTTLGFKPAGGIDGSYGPGTRTAVRNFQASAGLTQDGSAGPDTQKKIAEKIAEKNKPNPPSSSNRYLRRGSTGPDVLTLQRQLDYLGYKLSTDSSFGPATESVVKQFQKDRGIAIDGSAGPETQAEILKAVAEKNKQIAAEKEEAAKPKPKPTPAKNYLIRGDTGDEVRKLQEEFKALGYKVDVDGSFGPMLQALVRRFQEEHGLTVDGSAGPITRAKMTELLKAKESVPAKPESAPKPPAEPIEREKIKQEILEKISVIIDETLDKWL